MKRNVFYFGIGIAILFAASLAMAKDRKGPMTGTWECQAHGGSQGDMAVTHYLEQNKENVDGTISSPIGETQISSGTFKKGVIELRFETPQCIYVLTGNVKKNVMTEGQWATIGE